MATANDLLDFTDIFDTTGEEESDYSTALSSEEPQPTAEDVAETEEEKKRKAEAALFNMKVEEERQRLAASATADKIAGRGRAYMGPMISQSQFEQIPLGGNINLAGPPVTAPTELQRLQALDNPELVSRSSGPVPVSRTIAVQPPGMPPVTDVNYDLVQTAMQAQRRYEAQRGYMADVASGVDPVKARAKWALDMFGPTGTKPTSQLDQARIAQIQQAMTGGKPMTDLDRAKAEEARARAAALAAGKPLTDLDRANIEAIRAKAEQTKMGTQIQMNMTAEDAATTSGGFHPIDWLARKVGYAPENAVVPPPGTNIAPTIQPPVTPTPPPAPVKRSATPEEKQSRAKELRKEHPDWDTATILAKIREEFI